MKLFTRKTTAAPVDTQADPVDALLARTEARLRATRTEAHGAGCIGTRCPCSA